ncbi:MAG: hypothetical protein N3A59_06160 [Thermodesulfovibrionales bacterium]|nr:hypothetical protein [Thermodesulfovibrionales bacterium]
MEKEPKEKIAIEKERSEFKKLILENPNYFGTIPDYKIKPVKPMKANTKYEELRCIGFYPENDILEAIVEIKLPYGYSGNLCTDGSFEYVRFFVDWNGDGDFIDPDDDVGIVSLNVHDIPDTEKVCLDKNKPLSYALTLKINSKKHICVNPYLVKVRAILSWNTPPPPGNPNYSPVWGNVLDGWIQIKPAKFFLKDIITVVDLQKLKIDQEMLELDLDISKTKELTLTELKDIYKDKDVPELRFNSKELINIAESVKLDPTLMAKYKLEPKFSKMMEYIDLILSEKPNTKYEELRCVGLNYDLDQFVATLTVKLPYGYNGNLCTKGSDEYVAFWGYIWDQVEQVCYWKYFGTTSVKVYDIANIPPEGLQYAVYLPVDLSSYKDLCSKHKVMKIRAILSWNTPPPDNNPNYNPVWGNKVDALIQIKPGKPIEDGAQIPFISVVGAMAVESISGNQHTVLSSALGEGYANGPSVYGGFFALESSFGGVVTICGHISNPPNDPEDIDKLRYKVQYRKSGESSWHDITNTFRIWISTWNGVSWSIEHKDQVATEGYYKYEEDLAPPTQRFVEGNILAQWHTPVPEGDGLYEIRVLLYKLGALPTPGVPSDHISSNVVKIMIDNTRPQAEITLDAGPCEFTTSGVTITGKFKATDKHFWQYSISLLPYGPSTNDNFKHYPIPALEYIYGQVPSYPALPSSGVTNGTFILHTKGMKPCGYVLYLHVWDRTIVNNYMQGNQNSASVGFCLMKKE